MEQESHYNFVQFRCLDFVKNNRRQLTGVTQPKVKTVPSVIFSVFSHKQVGDSSNPPNWRAMDREGFCGARPGVSHNSSLVNPGHEQGKNQQGRILAE